MLYEFQITTPANTPEASKKKTVLELELGVIVRTIIEFPPGPAGLLHLQINRAMHQLDPRNLNGSIIGDRTFLDFEEWYELTEEPYQLEAYTWNEDDTYQHMVIVRFVLLTWAQLAKRGADWRRAL